MMTPDMDIEATPSRLAGLLISGSAGVLRGANRPQVGGSGWMVLKSDGTPHDTGGTPMATDTTGAAGDTETVTVSKAEFDALKADAAKAEAGKAAKDPMEDEKPDFLKKALDEMPAEVRKHFEGLQTQVAKAQADADTATAVAKAERDARLNAEYVAKAEAFSRLPTNADTLGPVLRSIDDLLPAAHAAEVLRLFKAAQESGTFTALTKSIGSSSGGTGGAADRITKAAEALVTQNPTMTFAQAMDTVAMSQPELAAAYTAERG